MPKMQEHFSASFRHNFGGRREGPSMALHSSIGHPAQLTPKIAPPLDQKKGSTSAPDTSPSVNSLFSFPTSPLKRGRSQKTLDDGISLVFKAIFLPPFLKGRVGVGFVARPNALPINT